MKQLATALVIVMGMASAYAQSTTRVDGYIKRDGTYVAPHTRTAPNSTTQDNYGTKGNTNPWTGKQGTKKAY